MRRANVPSQSNKRGELPKRRKPVPKPDGDGSDFCQTEDGDETVPTKGTPAVKNKDLQGLKYLDMIAPLLQRLHGDKCERDKAGN